MSHRKAFVTILSMILIIVLFAVYTAEADQLSTEAVGVIAYSRGNEIRLIGTDGGNDRRLWYAPLPAATFKGIRGLRWRPDGGALAFASDYQQTCSIYSSDIYTVRADGAELKRITNSPGCPELAAFPKGTVKVQVENRTTDGQFLIYVEGAPTAQLVTISPGAVVDITLPNVADLGDLPQSITLINGRYRWIDASVFVDVRAGQTVSASTRFVLNSQGNVFANVGATLPVWHRSGSKIGFLFYEGIPLQISANPPISGPDALILGPGAGVIATQMAWSPTNDSIVYADLDSINIVQPGASNGGTSLITKSASEIVLGIEWLPDGSGFLFSVTGGAFGQSNSNIYQYTFANNRLVQITNFADDFTGALTLSPNGREIVFEFNRSIGAPVELWFIRRDGTGLRPLGVNGESPDWRPGTGIDFTHRLSLPVVLKQR